MTAWFTAPDPATETWSAVAREELLDEPPTVEVDIVAARTVLHVHHHVEHIAQTDLLALALGVAALLGFAVLLAASSLGAPTPLVWAIHGLLTVSAGGSLAAIARAWLDRRARQ